MKPSIKIILFTPQNIIYLFIIIASLLSTDTASSCSIIGYNGDHPCKEFILEGLSRLEYRGYDSAGIAILEDKTHNMFCTRAVGKLENLKQKLSTDLHDGCIGIGHTRWATHGPAVERNAHPHLDTSNTLAVVHNGIIENHDLLKQQLQAQGCDFRSDTDTEVITHLMRVKLDSTNKKNPSALLATLVDVAHSLQGSYAFVACMKDLPETLILMRKGSPACIGIGEGEMFVASDFLALAGKTNKIVFMPEGSIAILKKDSFGLFDMDGNTLQPNVQTLDTNPEMYEKLGHEHFMLKEIYEQRTIIHGLVAYCRSLGDSVWPASGYDTQTGAELKASAFARLRNLLACGAHRAILFRKFLQYSDLCALGIRIQIYALLSRRWKFVYRCFTIRRNG